MPIFYFHPQNRIPQQLAEMSRQRGFQYTNRGELDLKLQRLLVEADYYIDPRFHTIAGSLAGTIQHHIYMNPDDELDRHSLKLCKQNTPWSYIKILNGKDMMFIMGYASSGGASPFTMGVTEMAQKGLIGVSHIPRPV